MGQIRTWQSALAAAAARQAYDAVFKAIMCSKLSSRFVEVVVMSPQ
jgi:hypothetical protein